MPVAERSPSASPTAATVRFRSARTFNFFETNDALTFDRAASRGMRLNIPAGTAVRFEPGQAREVELVDLAGHRRVFGFAGRVMGICKLPASKTY